MSTQTSEIIALSLLTVGEQAHSFSSFMPSRFTISNWVLDPAADPRKIDERIANLRSGYKPAVAFGLGLAGVVSMIAKSPLPILFSGVATVAMINLYEGALPAEKRLGMPEMLSEILGAASTEGAAALVGG